MKKIVSILLSVALMCISVPALAAGINENDGKVTIQRFIELSQATAGISINGKTAICTGTAKAQDSSFKINITMRLQKKVNSSWSTIATWSGSGSGFVGARLNKTKGSLSSGTYRTNLYVSVYSSDNKFIESTTVNSATRTIN